MLQQLNERIQGVIAWIVIVLVAITFSMFGIDYFLQSRHGSVAKVEVNGDVITKQAYDSSYQRKKQQHPDTELTVADENQLKQEVLDELVLNSLSRQAALSNGFDVNADLANAAIVDIPQFQEDGHFSANRYQHTISGAFFTPESFQDEVRQGMLLNQQRFAFIGTSFALPNDVQKFSQLYFQTRDYHYFEVPVAGFLNSINIPEDEIKRYYDQHQKTYLAPEKVSVDYVSLSKDKVKQTITISDEQIADVYNDNKAAYAAPEQWHFEHILYPMATDVSDKDAELAKTRMTELSELLKQNPELFDQKTKELAQDKETTYQLGELPWISAADIPYATQLKALNKPGQISTPIQTKDGYEIFKVIAYKPTRQKSLSEVKADIKQQLLSEAIETKYSELLERLSELSYQSPDTLVPVADALGLSIKSTEAFPRAGGTSDITKNNVVAQLAFSSDVLEGKNNSSPVQVNNDQTIVLRVKKYFPAKQLPMDQVFPEIKRQLVLTKAKQKAVELGQALLKSNDNGQKLTALLSKSITWHEVTGVSRESDDLSPEINELAFSIPIENSYSGKSLDNGNFIGVKLNKIHPGDLSKLDKEQVASISQQIEASLGMMDYDLYINQLMNAANVVRH